MLYLLFGAAALGLLALDQWAKLWTVANFAAPTAANIYSTPDPAKPFLPGLVELTRVHNYGAAWSSFSGQKWLLIGLTSVLLAIVLVLLVKRVVRHPLGVAACMLIFTGGVGNLIDRVRAGYVVDMFHFEFWPSYPVFNVADICVVIGAVIGSVYYLWLYEKYDAKQPKEEITDGEADAPTE
ncbi:MAG: signal peptidase II [Ruminococcaceae bacterium]|nr:signal peptidase II [Oscillospiraceae bacterium]